MSGHRVRHILLAVLVMVLLVAGFVGARFWRLARQARQLQLVLRQAAQHPATLAVNPARKQFSAGFLQMAFGDNPPLLAAVARLVADAQRADPNLGESRVTLLVVTYRQERDVVRDVALRLVGVPELEETVAAATADPTGGTEAAKQVYQMGRSLVGELGNRVRLLAAPEIEERERRLMDAVFQNQSRVIEEHLREPLRLVAVMPDPDPLVGGLAESAVIAVLLKATLSLRGADGELVALGYDRRRASELAEFLGDTRMLAGGLLRLKFTEGPVELLVRPVSQARIAAEGPSVIVRVELPEELMEVGLPRLIKGLSKALRSPGNPVNGK